ncbi:aldo/keto reductase [Deinococcus rubellus]|uniref:Aldo/keto reductase n=1 Tax=Deinococcus rubellus TaxID=1889240 RepID=A0ABY5YE38_9DEIO|nr:aldo/keto reductase [Deinococcus rubellus]UWX63288.1 aldo/keto reductase [Deinococcus rubellus]
MNLTDYRTLGRSGLIVSPLALGTMTFGNQSWGSSDAVSEQIFNTYLDAGGNFIDTADVYSGGRSEELVGQLIAGRSARDRVVLATKFGFNAEKGNPHAGGNGRKQIYRALEGSLKRLGTDYVDLYWLHVYDMVTPVEEVLHTLGDLVRSGRVRYFGFSDMPAWYAIKAATLAQVRGVPGPVAMQMEYSLVARQIEGEHRPAAREGGLGIVPWSPLAGGFLAGKYRQGEDNGKRGRLSGSNPFSGPFTKFTERNWQILDALRTVAEEIGRPPAQVALAWAVAQPGIASTLIGASKVSQLEDNLAALEINLTPPQLETLNTVSSPGLDFFSAGLRQVVFGGVDVRGWND